MHDEAMAFVRDLRMIFPEYFQVQRVAEIGSRNVNGSARELFTDCEYVGYDLCPGSGVDVVGRFACKPRSFDVVYSTETLEHDPMYLQTFEDMYLSCRSGGLLFFTCATTGRPEHGTRLTTPNDSPATVDYYRNLTPEDFGDLSPMFKQHAFTICGTDLYFWGIVK